MNYGRAVDLSPNFAYARALPGVSNAYAGNADLARTHIKKAIALSPRDTFLDKFYLYLSAAEAAERAIQMKSGHPSSHLFRTCALAHAGRQDEAEKACAAYLDLVPNARSSEIERTVLYYRAEDRARTAEGMRIAGLPN